MKKAVTLFGVIVFLIAIGSLFVCAVSAEEIIIDTEKVVPGFWTEPARDLPANWQYVQDHPDTSADGWFDTNAYPPERGNGSFWYTISFPDLSECKGIWETSVPYTGKYEVFVWIPSPDPFDPYLDESTPPSDYLPTKRAQYKVFHNGGVATVTIDQNGGGFTSLGVFVFDSTARVELSSNGVEFWRCVAFDAVKVKSNPSSDNVSPSKINLASRTIYVPDDYPTVHDAVNAANIDDIIIVRDRKYIDKYEGDKVTTAKVENPMVLFVILNEVKVTFMVGKEFWEPKTEFQIGEWVGLTLEGEELRGGDHPAIANDTTFVISDEVGNVIWNRSVGKVGEGWSSGPGGGWGVGVTWGQVDMLGNPVPAGNYAAGVMFTDPTFNFPEDFSGIIPLTIIDITTQPPEGWSEDTRLTVNRTALDHPSIAVDSDNNVHILWTDSRAGNWNLYYTKLDSNGNILIDDTKITPSACYQFTECSRQIAADSQGNMHIVWRVGNAIYYMKLDNNGKVLISCKFISSGHDPHLSYPNIVIDSSDNLHVAIDEWVGCTRYLKLNNNGDVLIEKQSIGEKPNWWCGEPSIAVDSQNKVYLTWFNSFDIAIHFTKLDCDGTTLINDTKVSSTQNSWEARPKIAIDSADDMHLIWLGKDENDIWQLYYMKLDNTGHILVEEKKITNRVTEQGEIIEDLSMSLDSADNLHIAWPDNRDGNFEIYYMKLDNNGNWLSPDIRLTSYGGASMSPSIANSNNKVHVVWYDNRHGFSDIYYKNKCIENNPPIANAGGPYSGNVNEDIQFYGSGTAPDGDAIIAYAWDFNNDGITDSTLQNPTYSWSSAGTYYPTLKVQDERGAWSEPNVCTVIIGLADQTTDRSQLNDSIINQFMEQYPNDPEKINEELMEYTNSEREERLLNSVLISTETEEQRNDIQTIIDSNTGDRNALLADISAYIDVNIADHQSFWEQVKNKFWSTKIPKDVHEIAEAINIFGDLMKKVTWLKPIAWGGTTISTIEDAQAQHEITQELDSSTVPTDTANALKIMSAITEMIKPFDKTKYYAPVTDATIGGVVELADKLTARQVSVWDTEEFKYIYNGQVILAGTNKFYTDDNGGAARIYYDPGSTEDYIKLQGEPKTDFISKLFGLREIGYWREIIEVGDNIWELVPIPKLESPTTKSFSALNTNESGIKIYNIFTEDLNGDGYANTINYDTDNDTIPDVILTDKNNDSLIDVWKFRDKESFLIAYDTDNNGIPDAFDFNDDGIINAWDLDEDGSPDLIDLYDRGLIDAFDTDYNGVLDSFVEYNQTLIAWINAPTYGSIFSQNDTIVFNASVYNGTKNGTAPYIFTWTSDICGFIGNGSLIESSTLPIGDHNITLIVQDSAGLTDTDLIFIVVKQNIPPTASFTCSPEKPVVNQTITFNASNSTDPDGNITKYDWDFGDGNITNTTEEMINHMYSLAGDYLVNLTVTDNDGATNATAKMITVSSMPDLEITAKWLCWPDNCTICYNVTNTGNGTAPAGHNTTLYVDGVAVAHDHVPVDLAPGESYIGCFNGYEWAYTPPSDNITVCADNNETLDELDEDNNCLTNIWMCGDVRKDGFVTAWDVAVLNSYVAGIGELEVEQKWAGDVRTDGYITAWDVAVLNSKVAGIGDISCMCTQPDI